MECVKPYEVWFPVEGNINDIDIRHIDVMEGSGFTVLSDVPRIGVVAGKGSVHFYTVRRN